METKSRLSTLWVCVLFNMLFADVFSIMVELVDKNTLSIPGEVKLVMAVAALVTNIPIMMIYFSSVLPFTANKWSNIAAAVFTIIYVVGGGSALPHYFIIASIELLLLLIIIIKCLQWVDNSENQ